jgi:hypothetical protein
VLRKVRAFYQVCALKNQFQRSRLTQPKILLKDGKWQLAGPI